MAAVLWPGETNDKRRFVETIVRFPCNVDTKVVSAPLLAADCDICRQGLRISNIAFRLTGEHDKNESEIRSLCTPVCAHFDKRQIRKYSYAYLLYKEVRCGFVHEYRPGDHATDGDQLRSGFGPSPHQISYVNCLDSPVASSSHAAVAPKRRIYFPLEWIAEVARGVAQGVDCECGGKAIFKEINLAKPNKRWIDDP